MSRVRRGLFLLGQRMAGSRAGARLRELRRLARLDAAALRRWQEAELAQVLTAAGRDVPFYRDRVPAGAADLAAFPVLTRADLHARYRDLMRADLRAEYEGRAPRARYGWIESRTGGTTGAPATVIHDANFRDWDRAARLLEFELCGYSFGALHARLWGSMADIDRARASRAARIMAWLAHERLLNAFMMEEARMAEHLDRLAAWRVDHLVAYVDAACALAEFARRTGRRPRPLVSIMACAGTVTEDSRALLRDVFGARVHNKYGSRDAGDTACECAQGGLHVFPHVLAEVVDEEGRPVPAGQAGRLLLTWLGNPSFPLIRYDIGDVAALRAGACSCGCAFPMLERVEGRAADFLRSVTGGYILPVLVRHLVGVHHNRGALRRFQLVQHDARRFTLRLEPVPPDGARALAETCPALLRDLRVVLGEGADLAVEIVARIPETDSGKFRYAVREAAGDSAP